MRLYQIWVYLSSLNVVANSERVMFSVCYQTYMSFIGLKLIGEEVIKTEEKS